MEKAYQRIIKNFNSCLKGLIGGLVLSSALWAFEAQAEGIRLISDEETEQFLAEIVQPLFKAAGIPFYRDRIFIVEDNSLNAFVADGNRLFVHTQTLIRADSVNELSGVLAHESGHIMGGHILRQKLKAQDMNQVSLISAVLAGAGAALSGRGDVAMAVMLGSQNAALNHYTAYRTAEERSADEAAVKLLAQTGQSPQGILRFMKKLAQDNMLNGRVEMPYFRTHPVTGERIAFFEKQAAQSSLPATSASDEKFARIKAKLKAYLLPAEQIRRDYPAGSDDIPAQYARAIADMKQLKFAPALQKINKLISLEPDNPYFYELKGQLLLETGQIKDAQQSFAAANRLLPQSALMQINYAQALLAGQPDKTQAGQAAVLLNKAVVRTPNAFAWMLLSQAEGISGNMAAAQYAAAEYSFRTGAPEIAGQQLKQARKYPASRQLALKIDDLALRLKNLKKDGF